MAAHVRSTLSETKDLGDAAIAPSRGTSSADGALAE
jgi:hypothetical protein